MQLTSRESLMPRTATDIRRSSPSGNRLGERVRQLRVAAGQTQTDLAGDRFSKEYVSQIERGKTRPTRETIEWLAVKLGVDPGFLERGVSRYQLSSISTAVNLLNESLTLAEASELPCDRLRADILGWRSRCYRRQRDFEAAREDVERALELAQALDDPRKTADTYFQA